MSDRRRNANSPVSEIDLKIKGGDQGHPCAHQRSRSPSLCYQTERAEPTPWALSVIPAKRSQRGCARRNEGPPGGRLRASQGPRGLSGFATIRGGIAPSWSSQGPSGRSERAKLRSAENVRCSECGRVPAPLLPVAHRNLDRLAIHAVAASRLRCYGSRLRRRAAATPSKKASSK